jgi:hypothetical protein
MQPDGTTGETGHVVYNEIPTQIVHENDGSKTRHRFHHGIIAQEVKNVMDNLGVDFGGYQDHSVNGGKDLLTIGYEEFIGPLIKSVQELNIRANAIHNKIISLGNTGTNI